MQLLQIKKSRSSDKVWLTFDDGSFIPFKMDDVVIHKIKTGIVENYNLLCELTLKLLITSFTSGMKVNLLSCLFILRQH